MRLSLNRKAWQGTPLACAGLLLLAPTGARAAGQAAARVERRVGLMGTELVLSVEAPSRAQALSAGERALRALEAAEARLSTWRDDSELARLNRAPVGERFELSEELAAELHEARRWWRRTGGGFDPAIGGLVRAWGLRTGGRTPGEEELRAARVQGGFDALELDGRRALRRQAALLLEEGGFGKGAGLDAALRALRETTAQRAFLDLGGQAVVLGAEEAPFAWGVAHPRERDVAVLRLSLARGSLATSGNGERGGHLLDPRSGEPAPDFGSLTVWAPDALAADCLSTGLFVLGPEAALRFARDEPDVEVLVLELLPDGALRARATGALARGLERLDPRVLVEPDAGDAPDDPPAVPAGGADHSLSLTHG